MARRSASDEGSKPVKISRQSLRQAAGLLAYLRPYRFRFGLGLLMLAVSSISSLALFTFVGDLFDITKDNFASEIRKIAIVLAILLVVQTIASFLRVYLFSYTAENIVARLKQDTFSRLVSLPMRYFSEKRVGELTARVASDITSIKETFTTTLATFIREFIIITGSIAFLTWSNWKMVLFILAVLPLVVIFALVFGRKVRKISKEAQQANAEATTVLEESLQAIATVKAFTGELFEMARFSEKNRQVAAKGIRNGLYTGAFVSFLIVFMFGSIVAVIWYGASLVAAGEISSGQLFEFFIISIMMAASMGGLADSFNSVQRALGATESVFGILAEEPEDNGSGEFRLNGHIEFRHVRFAYPDKPAHPVLTDINFSVEPGEQVAFVGPSGAGKSTLTHLLLRLYEPLSGQILAAGEDIAGMPLSAYRRNVAIVPQEVILFGGNIRENIRYGNPTASDAEVEEAARRAFAHDFITKLPDGYDTIVGERGTKLSGGQRQRVAIARAFIKNPAILVLDEATSALDSESERSVQQALNELMKGRTTFVVAHRLSTIRNADKIIVLEKGEIREMGNHNQLMENNEGLYRHLASLQFRV